MRNLSLEVRWLGLRSYTLFCLVCGNIPAEKHRDLTTRKNIAKSAAPYALNIVQIEELKRLEGNVLNTYLLGMTQNALWKLRYCLLLYLLFWLFLWFWLFQQVYLVGNNPRFLEQQSFLEARIAGLETSSKCTLAWLVKTGTKASWTCMFQKYFVFKLSQNI